MFVHSQRKRGQLPNPYCNRKVIMSPFSKIEMLPKITVSKGDCDENRGEGHYVNRETLRQWMLAEGLWETRRKVSGHRQWRERKECFGEMVQIGGSHHDWLEGRGPRLVMMGYIDDATGHVFARFYEYEGRQCRQWTALIAMRSATGFRIVCIWTATARTKGGQN